MQKKSILIFVACLLVISTKAQHHLWTFQQCLDTALQRNISLNESRENNELNRINLDQSKASLYPYLSATGRDGVGFGRSLNPTTNQYLAKTTNSSSFGLSSAVTLFNGFQLTNTILQNKMNLDAGSTDIDNIKNQVTLNLTTAYLQVLFDYEILDAAKSQANATAVQVDQTEKQVKAGSLPESNLYTIRAQQATDNLAVVNAQSTLDLAKVTLEQIMELPIVDSFDLKVPDFVEPAIMMNKTNQEIYAKALTIQPQIAGASLRTNSALLGIRISEGARYPTLSLSGAANSNYAVSSRTGVAASVPKASPFFPQLWNNLGESIGLNLSIPIYSNRTIKSNIERAKVNALLTQLNEQDLKLQLRTTIEQSYTDLKNSIKKYEATKDQIASAELAYKNMERKYKVGMATAIDFLIEKNAFYQAQSNGIQAKYDYIFKSKILDFYQGVPITF
ncbi:MAG: TolC family protein [Bacteroidales bacterium]|jgi:outer membrane protein